MFKGVERLKEEPRHKNTREIKLPLSNHSGVEHRLKKLTKNTNTENQANTNNRTHARSHHIYARVYTFVLLLFRVCVPLTCSWRCLVASDTGNYNGAR